MTPAEHLSAFERLIIDSHIVKSSHVIERQSRRFDSYIKVRLTLIDDSLLDVTEYVRATDEVDARLMRYSYHWMEPSGELRLRWDNVRHYSKLPGFPHHLHDREEKRVVSSEPMTLAKVFDRIERELGTSYGLKRP